MTSRRTVFVAYSHKDRRWKDFVVGHFRVLERQGTLEVWEDSRIRRGDWRAEIEKALARANAGVLLISHNSLNSDFIMNYELSCIIRKHMSNNFPIFPILISDCAWASVDWLNSITIWPRYGVPLDSLRLSRRHTIMKDICNDIQTCFNKKFETSGSEILYG